MYADTLLSECSNVLSKSVIMAFMRASLVMEASFFRIFSGADYPKKDVFIFVRRSASLPIHTEISERFRGCVPFMRRSASICRLILTMDNKHTVLAYSAQSWEIFPPLFFAAQKDARLNGITIFPQRNYSSATHTL